MNMCVKIFLYMLNIFIHGKSLKLYKELVMIISGMENGRLIFTLLQCNY